MKNWRLNVTIYFPSIESKQSYQELIHTSLKSFAQLKGIDLVIREFPREHFLDSGEPYTIPEEAQFEIAYFRSSPKTVISSRDFRKLAEMLFSEQNFLLDSRFPFEVNFQKSNILKLFPFPD